MAHGASQVRAAALPINALSFAKAISMGLGSGGRGGRKRNRAPFALSVSAARALVWLDRLSRSEAPNGTGPRERAGQIARAEDRGEPGVHAAPEPRAAEKRAKAG